MKSIKIKYILIVILSIILFPLGVDAKEKIELKVDKSDLNIGDEIKVSASVSSEIDAYSLVGTLKYDKNVFEKIGNKNFSSSNGDVLKYNKDNNKFGIINKTGKITSSDENIFTIHLKVKDNANVGDTSIALTNISYSDGNVKKTLDKTSVKVLVTRDAKEGEVLPVNMANKIKNDKDKVVKTSTNILTLILIGVIIGIVLVLIVYIYDQKKHKKKSLYFLVPIEVVLICVMVSLFAFNHNKKDVNHDGKKDYADASKIVDYLINIEGDKEKENHKSNDVSYKTSAAPNKKDVSSNEKRGGVVYSRSLKKESYDVNNDGVVDVEDAGYVVREVTKKSKVSLKEVKNDKEFYMEKGEILLKFKADITPSGVSISKVKVDDKYYDVEYRDGVYSVLVDTFTKSGKHEFVISEVVLDNLETINTDLKIEKEILKDKPYVNNFDLDDKEGTLSFNLVDKDDAFIDGTVTIYDDSEEVKSEKVSSVTKIKDIPVEEDKTYLVEVIGKYDLDSDKKDKKNHYDKENMFTHTFMIGGDYNFSLSDVKITDAVEKGNVPIISFKSSNVKNSMIENVSVSIDKESSLAYKISKSTGDEYEVALENAPMTPGRHTVTLDSVSLDSLKLFENKKDYKANTLVYTVLKDKPKVEELNLVHDKDKKEIKAEFKLEDKNLAVKKLNVLLVDSLGKIVSSKEILKDELEEFIKQNKTIKTDLSYEKNVDGFYTVKVLADYNLADKYSYTNESLLEKEILTHEDDIYIESMYITNDKNAETTDLYPSKNQKNYQLAVVVHVGDNVNSYARSHYKNANYQNVSNITINGLNYTAIPVSGYKSKVYINVPGDAGVSSIKANRVQLSINNYYNIVNDFYSVKEKEIKIDILKDKPKIEDLKIDEDYDNGKATFNFSVTLDKNSNGMDNDFSDGVIELDGKTHEIHAGKNSVVFNDIEKDKNLDLKFIGSYDLDTDTLNDITGDKNDIDNDVLYETKYGLYDKSTYEDIEIKDGDAVSDDGDKYFEKNEKVKLQFKVSGIDEKLEVLPERVVIDNKEYFVEKDKDTYSVVLDGYSSAKKRDVSITDIILNNGKSITLEKPYKFSFEVLKDIVKVDDYEYEDLDGKLRVLFNLKDSDNSLVSKARVEIVDDKDNVLYSGDYKNDITFDKVDNVLRYHVRVIGDYDRDIDKTKDSDNYNSEVLLLDEVISLEDNNILFKDISDVNVYKNVNVDGEEVIELEDEIDVADISKNKDDYFVQIIMNNIPTVYAKIKNVITKNNMLTLVLDYEYATVENYHEKQTVRIDFGSIKGDVATNELHPGDSFKVLLDELNAGKDITLTHDYDASSISSNDDYYVVKDYSGVLDGNGYTIRNLDRPLFKNIVDGTVRDLKLENITFSHNNTLGTLAQSVSGSLIDGVLINNYLKTSTESNTGTLVGSASKTTIKNCRSTNFKMAWGWHNIQQVGGLVSSINDSTIKNSYVVGEISGGWNYRAGLVAKSVKSTIENNYTKVNIGYGMGDNLVYDIVNADENTIIKNNVSLNTGNRASWSKTKYKEMENNYYLDNSESTISGMKSVSKDDITTELFRDTLKFNEKVWDLKEISVDVLPKLVLENKTSIELYSGYDPSKKTLYKNLMLLAPFYDNEKIVEEGSVVTDNNLINKEIKHILPVDSTGNIVTYLTNDNPKKINKLKIVFRDGSKIEYNVSYEKNYDMVAAYKINSLGVDYNYNHYIINRDSQVVNNLYKYLEKLDYTNNLDILTTNDDSRIYIDFYNENTKYDLEEFILKYLSNSNYTNTTNNESINNYIEREIKKNNNLEKVLYTYNYFKRFYDLDVDGMKIYDFMMFNMEGFDKTLTPNRIVDLFFQDKSGSNFNTNETNTKYNSVLSGYTKLENVSSLLEYIVTKFSSHDMDEWTRSQFKGILTEMPVQANKDVQYTLWDHLSTEDANRKGSSYKVHNFVLPILTLPETSAYIISGPVQFIIGSQRTYMKNPNDPTEKEEFMQKLNSYTTRMNSYFETAYSLLQNKKLFNDMHLFHLDKRYTKNEFGASVFNTPNSTTDLFHKNFNEVVHLWSAAAGVNAGAWGDYVEWQVAGVLDSTLATDGTFDVGHVTFKTWSHESAHNIDARLFLKNNGRRYDAGGEDYADDFLMQAFSENEIVMNLSINFNKDLRVASNTTPERINSKEKIWDFYKKAFDTIYVMDYLEAKAFLQLSKEEQRALAVQISYPNEDLLFQTVDGKGHDYNKERDMFTGKTYKDDPYAKFRARQTTKYTHLNEIDDFDKEFKTIYDLIDNRIMLYPGVYKYSSRGSNSYGGEGFNTVHWYQPNNPDGRPDSYALKWLSYEMLGYKGYDNGFVEYASNSNPTKSKVYKEMIKGESGGISEINNYKTDNMAISKISNGKYKNITDYKKARFKEIENKLEKLDNTIDVKEYVQKLYEALKEDAKDITVGVKNIISKNPGCPSDYWCSRGEFAKLIGLQHSTKVRQDIYHTLKFKTNDFVDDIFLNTKQQDVSNLEVDKE